MSKNQSRPTLRERVADTVGISKEVILDTVLLSAIGNREITLENYKSILSYSDTVIKIKTNPRVVELAGTNLEIRTISRDMLYITGRINTISFQE